MCLDPVFWGKIHTSLTTPTEIQYEGATYVFMLSFSQWHEFDLGNIKGVCQLIAEAVKDF